MGDSWEDADGSEKPKAAFSFNPNAASFSFNPNATSFEFKPAGAAAPEPEPAAVEPEADAAPPPPPEPAPAPAPPAPTPEELAAAAREAEEMAATKAAAKEEAAAKEAEVAAQKALADEQKAAKAKAKEDARLAEEARLLELEDKREHVNLVFIGHVDAGKSTIGGQILFLTGMVDDRTIQKYEREAKDKNRDSWYMAYIMDTNEEERAKGKTVEVGRAHFATDKKRYTVLDAPGHKNYVPNMIAGAAQADVAVLVIAARKGEFETGFERGGQTREHAQLAKTLGVAKLVVVVNKMDDPSVKWAKERFDEVVTKLTPFLKSCGYNMKKDVTFVPISGLHGYNIRDAVSKESCPWYEGKTLFETLDGLEPQDRDPDAPFRMPVMDKYREMGVMVMGKSEAGTVTVGDKLVVMPGNQPVKVAALYNDTAELARARPGENIRLRIEGVEEENVLGGFVMCSADKPCPVTKEFDAMLSVLELHEHKSLFTAGYTAVLHIHTLVAECEVTALLSEIDPKTKTEKKGKCLFLKSGSIAKVRIKLESDACMEKFSTVPQMGRFTLRDEGKTIAIGKVERMKVKKAG